MFIERMCVCLQAAHQHPSSHSHGASTRHADVTEMEYKAWHDLPQDPSLTALGKGASATSRWVGGTVEQCWYQVGGGNVVMV